MKKFLLSFFVLLLVSANAYDFSMNGTDYNYNENEMKFYKVQYGSLLPLSKIEVSELFPQYEVILISQFDNNKKIKVKKSFFKAKKILLLNDTNYRTFHGFEIYPLSSRDDFQGSTKIKSLITIYGSKNVRLKHPGGDEFEIVVH